MPDIDSVTVNYTDGSSATFTAQNAEPTPGVPEPATVPVEDIQQPVGEAPGADIVDEGVAPDVEPDGDEAASTTDEVPPNPEGNAEQL